MASIIGCALHRSASITVAKPAGAPLVKLNGKYLFDNMFGVRGIFGRV